MASDKISVSVESTDVVYDVRVNGLPLIKSKDLSPRSLQIPAYHMFKEGSNTLEVNVMGVYENKEGDIIKEFSDKSSLYVSIVKNGNKVDAFNLSYDADKKVLVDGNKTYTGRVAQFASDDVKVVKEDDFVGSVILTGRFKNESISKKKEVVVRDFKTSKDFWIWREGDHIDSKDIDLLKLAYENQYQKIKSNNREDAIKPLYPMYELVAKKYNGTSLQEYLEENNVIETFSAVRTSNGNQYEIMPPDFSRTTFDILDDGRLARIFPDPLIWEFGDRKIDSRLLFYKKDGVFIPFFISNDTDF
ncbi:hypothetical protein Q8W30_10890 [Neptunomonas phycophila]|uniref:Uncharacterized protein n=1 Tax=Neptunomonas phycophila TaxID=1572645 RepID=A0ABT9EVX2_9GAMM|nr:MULTISPECIES: hypothetical protein [Neptunomonas]MDN2660061.1 hypothetical protein [Neptunomonas sp. CHC150]MDP2523075.1 hypothetical protein [Neptunomonas phycophila]